MFLARVYVTLKPTVNDPQGRTILGGLKSLGFDLATEVRAGKYLEIKVASAERAGEAAGQPGYRELSVRGGRDSFVIPPSHPRELAEV